MSTIASLKWLVGTTVALTIFSVCAPALIIIRRVLRKLAAETNQLQTASVQLRSASQQQVNGAAEQTTILSYNAAIEAAAAGEAGQSRPASGGSWASPHRERSASGSRRRWTVSGSSLPTMARGSTARGSARPQGSGKVVERHGGRIWVDSTPGKGTTFHFTLPAPAPEPVQVS